jgi:hypothetical protein
MVKGLLNFAAIFFSILVLPALLQNMIDVAYILQIHLANLHAALNFVHERIALLIFEIFVDKYCVQNELSLQEITFLNLLKDGLLAVVNTF